MVWLRRLSRAFIFTAGPIPESVMTPSPMAAKQPEAVPGFGLIVYSSLSDLGVTRSSMRFRAFSMLL